MHRKSPEYPTTGHASSISAALVRESDESYLSLADQVFDPDTANPSYVIAAEDPGIKHVGKRLVYSEVFSPATPESYLFVLTPTSESPHLLRPLTAPIGEFAVGGPYYAFSRDLVPVDSYSSNDFFSIRVKGVKMTSTSIAAFQAGGNISGLVTAGVVANPPSPALYSHSSLAEQESSPTHEIVNAPLYSDTTSVRLPSLGPLRDTRKGNDAGPPDVAENWAPAQSVYTTLLPGSSTIFSTYDVNRSTPSTWLFPGTWCNPKLSFDIAVAFSAPPTGVAWFVDVAYGDASVAGTGSAVATAQIANSLTPTVAGECMIGGELWLRDLLPAAFVTAPILGFRIHATATAGLNLIVNRVGSIALELHRYRQMDLSLGYQFIRDVPQTFKLDAWASVDLVLSASAERSFGDLTNAPLVVGDSDLLSGICTRIITQGGLSLVYRGASRDSRAVGVVGGAARIGNAFSFSDLWSGVKSAVNTVGDAGRSAYNAVAPYAPMVWNKFGKPLAGAAIREYAPEFAPAAAALGLSATAAAAGPDSEASARAAKRSRPLTIGQCCSVQGVSLDEELTAKVLRALLSPDFKEGEFSAEDLARIAPGVDCAIIGRDGSMVTRFEKTAGRAARTRVVARVRGRRIGFAADAAAGDSPALPPVPASTPEPDSQPGTAPEHKSATSDSSIPDIEDLAGHLPTTAGGTSSDPPPIATEDPAGRPDPGDLYQVVTSARINAMLDSERPPKSWPFMPSPVSFVQFSGYLTQVGSDTGVPARARITARAVVSNESFVRTGRHKRGAPWFSVHPGCPHPKDTESEMDCGCSATLSKIAGYLRARKRVVGHASAAGDQMDLTSEEPPSLPSARASRDAGPPAMREPPRPSVPQEPKGPAPVWVGNQFARGRNDLLRDPVSQSSGPRTFRQMLEARSRNNALLASPAGPPEIMGPAIELPTLDKYCADHGIPFGLPGQPLYVMPWYSLDRINAVEGAGQLKGPPLNLTKDGALFTAGLFPAPQDESDSTSYAVWVCSSLAIATYIGPGGDPEPIRNDAIVSIPGPPFQASGATIVPRVVLNLSHQHPENHAQTVAYVRDMIWDSPMGRRLTSGTFGTSLESVRQEDGSVKTYPVGTMYLTMVPVGIDMARGNSHFFALSAAMAGCSGVAMLSGSMNKVEGTDNWVAGKIGMFDAKLRIAKSASSRMLVSYPDEPLEYYSDVDDFWKLLAGSVNMAVSMGVSSCIGALYCERAAAQGHISRRIASVAPPDSRPAELMIKEPERVLKYAQDKGLLEGIQKSLASGKIGRGLYEAKVANVLEKAAAPALFAEMTRPPKVPNPVITDDNVVAFRRRMSDGDGHLEWIRARATPAAVKLADDLTRSRDRYIATAQSRVGQEQKLADFMAPTNKYLNSVTSAAQQLHAPKAPSAKQRPNIGGLLSALKSRRDAGAAPQQAPEPGPAGGGLGGGGGGDGAPTSKRSRTDGPPPDLPPDPDAMD